MTNFLCELIERCKKDPNFPKIKDFTVEPLLLKDHKGFMIFSNDNYYIDKTESFSKIAQKHFKDFPQRHRFYIYNKLNNKNGRNIIFILYNPSYANPLCNDPTINNCINKKKKYNEFSSVEILNIYSERNPKVNNLEGANNSLNIEFITELLRLRADSEIVLAWGNKHIPKEIHSFILNLQEESKHISIITSTKPNTKMQIRHPGNQGWSRLGGFKNSAKLTNIKNEPITLKELLKV